ncbi:MAG: cytochrome c oxidase subunit 3 [Terriglobia bacterium]
MSPVTLESNIDTGHALPPVLRIDDKRGTFGICLFITTEAMLFAVLFFTYFYLEKGEHRWSIDAPPKLHYSLPMLAVLIVSSIILHWGEKQVKQERYSAGKKALIATIALGIIFLILSYFEYAEHLKTLTPWTDSYGSIFYGIVSLHVLHITLGLCMLFWTLFLPRWGPSQYTPYRPYHNASLYWHFVDTVWVFIIAILYVAPNIAAAMAK